MSTFGSLQTVLGSRPPGTNSFVPSIPTASAALGLRKDEYGSGLQRMTVWRFSNVRVATTDNTTNGANASIQLGDFPAGAIAFDGIIGSLTITRESTGLAANAAVVTALGTAASDANATLTGTEANVYPSTATTLSSGTATFSPESFNLITSLTDSSGGTASDTIAAIGATYVQAEVRNAVASLAAKINAILAAQNSRQVVIDGTTTDIDLFLNFAVPDAGSTANDALLVTGDLFVMWKNLGDN